MIEIAFDESSAGSLKFAKGMKPGEQLSGATAVIGGTEEDRREAMKPRVWAGAAMPGSPADVAALTLALDIGDISGMDESMDGRKRLLDGFYADFPGVSDSMWETNEHTLARIREAKSTKEPIRIWVCPCDPAELCGLYYVCHLLSGSAAPLSVVTVPQETERQDCIVSRRSTGEIPPEELGALQKYEVPVSALRRGVYASFWQSLTRENAKLRAVVNGTVMGVPEDFYDFALRAHMPEGDTVVARLIGAALGATPGVGDRWLYLRVQAMIQSGELIEASKPTGDHPYSGVVRKKW